MDSRNLIKFNDFSIRIFYLLPNNLPPLFLQTIHPGITCNFPGAEIFKFCGSKAVFSAGEEHKSFCDFDKSCGPSSQKKMYIYVHETLHTISKRLDMP